MWELDPPIFNNPDLRNIGIDQAFVNITSTTASRLWVYTLTPDCIEVIK